MNNRNPLVSVIIPCYNHERFVGDCLKSVLRQTYNDIELIIIDDCSVDKSFEIIDSMRAELLSRFKRVEIKQNIVNLGITKNLNRMLAWCEGDYIKMIASDDMLTEDAIEKMVLCASENNADVYFSNGYIINENIHIDDLDQKVLVQFYESPPKDGKNLTDELLIDNYILAPSVFIPKETYERYGKYDESLSFEDWEYWLRIAESGKYKYNDTHTVFYRRLSDSASHFQLDLKGRRRHRKYQYDKIRIIKKYSGNRNVLGKLLNAEYSEAVTYFDRIMANYIYNIGEKNNVVFNVKHRIIQMTWNMGLYGIYRKTKMKLRRFL